ncbi:PREDICTED: uncharacterized protein LOC104822774 [Tarenaya hassleriana]|uniref:uncharacterized protein LOC104822774 n=1 Tax=Tarenaya hassleriana TaxID=28532 RepID=UPI00053C5BC9|nr:PREDICTED: uncharacterized protein LOC104822774 [Tarenaya hassleriana]
MSTTSTSPTSADLTVSSTPTPATFEAPRRTISPYDLSPSDNPGLVLSHPLLRGTNYEEWSINIRHALKSRKKFGFVDGKIPQPDLDSPDYEDWETNNSLIVSWIKNTLEPGLRSDVIHREFARDLWDYLKRRFGMTNATRLLRLRADLANCRQKGMSVEAYFGKLTKLWDDLASVRVLKSCKCGLCTCNLVTELEKQKQEDRLYEFLLGLDDIKYGVVRSTLLSRVPLPTVEEAYLIVTQDEESKGSLSRVADVSAFSAVSVDKTRATSAVKDKTMVCSNCGRTGHSAESCFQILGYPEWWGDRPRNRTNRGRGGSSSSRGRGVARSNAVSAAPAASSPAILDSDKPPVSGLSNEQWQTLVSLLNAGKIGATETISGMCSNVPWILDTGASHHMTGCPELLTNLSPMTSSSIILPDGRQSFASQSGSVFLTAHLHLSNVYLVEGLHVNLISVSQLLDDRDFFHASFAVSVNLERLVEWCLCCWITMCL